MSSEDDSDDDFAAELEAEMAVEQEQEKPTVAAPAVVIAAQAPSTGRGAVASLLKGAMERQAAAKAGEAKGDSAPTERSGVKRRRVAPSGNGPGDGDKNPADDSPVCPPHPGFMFDICIRCGLKKEKGDAEEKGTSGSTAVRYIHQGLEMSNTELEKAKREEKARILRSGRLVLVLDLDHTLLNSARFSELSQEEHYVMHRIIAAADCEANGGGKDDVQRAAAAIQAVEDPAAVENAETKKDGAGEDGEKGEDGEDEAGEDEKSPDEEEKSPDEDEKSPDGPFPGTDPPLRNLNCLRHMAMFTKLRPHAHAFLRAASQLCTMYIYTMGDRNYAREMAKLLDPTGELFNGRVIGSGDSTSQHKKDLDIVLGAEPTVLITDDTDRVWPKNLANLIRIDRYHFFKQSAAGFRQPGRSVMEREWRDEGDNGDRVQLRDVLGVIAAAHRRFFEGTAAANTADDATADMDAAMLRSAAETEGAKTRNSGINKPVSDEEAALKLESRDVRRLLTVPEDGPLADVRVVFSRVVAQSEPRPERHPLWLLATALGAEVLTSVDDGKGATHIVAHAEGDGDGGRKTEKVKWAAKSGASAVSADWLAKCGDEWARVDESRYSLLGPEKNIGGKVREKPVVETAEEAADVAGSPPGSPGYSA